MVDDIHTFSPAQLAHRCRMQMRPTKRRQARSLRSVCIENGWDYNAVYNRIARAGLLESVMSAKYEAVPA